MRILHTAHSYSPDISGVAEVVKQLSVRLAHRGHEVHIATRQMAGSSAEEKIDGVHVHRFDVVGNAVTGMKGTVDSYVRFVRSSTWDVIALHCAQAWTTDALLAHLGSVQSAKVFVGHGLSALLDPKYRTYYDSLAIALRQVDEIVALSELLEEVPFCDHHGLKAPHIIPNGVDPIEWQQPQCNIRSKWGIGNRPWILTVSNHSPVKGHSTFFDVVRQVRKQVPNVQGTIIGGNYAAARWGIGRWGVKGGCWYQCWAISKFRHDVTLRLNIARQHTVSAIKEADLVLITSWREASPLVALESAAAGTPWIAFNVGAIQDNAGGLVASSTKEMISATVRLLGDKSQREQLGQTGRTWIAEGHVWEQIVEQYERLYVSVLMSRK